LVSKEGRITGQAGEFRSHVGSAEVAEVEVDLLPGCAAVLLGDGERIGSARVAGEGVRVDLRLNSVNAVLEEHHVDLRGVRRPQVQEALVVLAIAEEVIRLRLGADVLNRLPRLEESQGGIETCGKLEADQVTRLALEGEVLAVIPGDERPIDDSLTVGEVVRQIRVVQDLPDGAVEIKPLKGEARVCDVIVVGAAGLIHNVICRINEELEDVVFACGCHAHEIIQGLPDENASSGQERRGHAGAAHRGVVCTRIARIGSQPKGDDLTAGSQ